MKSEKIPLEIYAGSLTMYEGYASIQKYSSIQIMEILSPSWFQLSPCSRLHDTISTFRNLVSPPAVSISSCSQQSHGWSLSIAQWSYQQRSGWKSFFQTGSRAPVSKCQVQLAQSNTPSRAFNAHSSTTLNWNELFWKLKESSNIVSVYLIQK